jgi:hypothetical protein
MKEKEEAVRNALRIEGDKMNPPMTDVELDRSYLRWKRNTETMPEDESFLMVLRQFPPGRRFQKIAK